MPVVLPGSGQSGGDHKVWGVTPPHERRGLGRGAAWIDLSNIHFGLEVDHQLNMALPSARTIAATRTLATLSVAAMHLWTDWSVFVNGDSRAGFAVFVLGILLVTEASPAGHGIFEFRAEAMACFCWCTGSPHLTGLSSLPGC